MSRLRTTILITALTHMGGIGTGFDPAYVPPGKRPLTDEEARFLDGYSGEVRRIWIRRVQRGLTASEIEFMRARLSQVAESVKGGDGKPPRLATTEDAKASHRTANAPSKEV